MSVLCFSLSKDTTLGLCFPPSDTYALPNALSTALLPHHASLAKIVLCTSPRELWKLCCVCGCPVPNRMAMSCLWGKSQPERSPGPRCAEVSINHKFRKLVTKSAFSPLSHL